VIAVDERGPVSVVTLDRPERRNAVDGRALADLSAALDGAVARRARVLVLTGAGGHFSAGADLKALEDERFATTLRTVLDGLAAAPLCTIAAVEGAALGAGTQLAIACDLRVATPTARFGVPAARLGLMVDAPTVQRLAALVGGSVARAVLLAAEVLDGETAHRVGLVARLGDLDAALAWADEIAALAPLTVAGHKLALERLTPRLPEDPEVAAAFRRAWASADLAEGRAAFAERRPPRFRGE
jgi:enoyl-CoA hydratase